MKINRHILPPNHGNHPNKRFANDFADYITIHETANTNAGANALGHATWMMNAAGYSWHVTVDDKAIWQSLEWYQQGWHAGDGANGPGNTTSIGIELCVAQGMDFTKVRENAAWLVRHLLSLGHGKKGIVQHNHWSGKNCPTFIRREGIWQKFLDMCKEEEPMTEEERREQLQADLRALGWADAKGPLDARLREVDSMRFRLARLAFDPDASRIEKAIKALQAGGIHT